QRTTGWDHHSRWWLIEDAPGHPARATAGFATGAAAATVVGALAAFVRRDPFLQLHDLEAALLLRPLLFSRLGGLLRVPWFHSGTSFQTSGGLRCYRKLRTPGGQTHRPVPAR